MTTTISYCGIYANIADRITGRIATPEDEAILLAETVADSAVHIETGCLWGGTTILAVLAGAKLVYTVDPMRDGFWKVGDYAIGKMPSTAAVIGNFRKFGVYERIKMIIAPSYPFPIPGLKPDTFFIDGDHSYKGFEHDWETASGITKRAILVHDYGDDQPYRRILKKAIDEIAMPDPGWEMMRQVGSMLLFERAV